MHNINSIGRFKQAQLITMHWLSDKGHVTKGKVFWNGWDLEPLDLLNGVALGYHLLSTEDFYNNLWLTFTKKEIFNRDYYLFDCTRPQERLKYLPMPSWKLIEACVQHCSRRRSVNNVIVCTPPPPLLELLPNPSIVCSSPPVLPIMDPIVFCKLLNLLLLSYFTEMFTSFY